MIIFIINLILVFVWALTTHLIFRDKIPLKEAVVQAFGATLLSIIFIVSVYYKNMHDTAVINGQVSDKISQKVSCSHSYRCMCYTSCSGTGSNRTCTEHCQTCYEHSFDVDWLVKTTVGNFEIARVNRQGTKEPPRWSAVKIGEPASSTESYINYVKAAPKSLFSMDKLENDNATFGGLFPKYPEVYDYYRIRRVMTVGTHYSEADKLNANLNNALRSLGPKKQVNINVIFVKTTNPEYRYALERAWVGGKKNDVTVIIGMDNEGHFSWTDVITFGGNAGNEMFAVLMRDRIKALASAGKISNADELSNVIATTVESDFVRKPMSDFVYLKEDFAPSGTSIIWFVVIQILFLTTSTIFLYYNDLFNAPDRSRYPSYTRYPRLTNQMLTTAQLKEIIKQRNLTRKY